MTLSSYICLVQTLFIYGQSFCLYCCCRHRVQSDLISTVLGHWLWLLQLYRYIFYMGFFMTILQAGIYYSEYCTTAAFIVLSIFVASHCTVSACCSSNSSQYTVVWLTMYEDTAHCSGDVYVTIYVTMCETSVVMCCESSAQYISRYKSIKVYTWWIINQVIYFQYWIKSQSNHLNIHDGKKNIG